MSLPSNFKPMLACNIEDITKFNRFPVYVQPKLDGIRCIIYGNSAVSRTNKYIPNKYVNKCLIENQFPSEILFDGELLTYTKGELDSFNTIQSKIMSENGEPEFKYAIFDRVFIHQPHRKSFQERFFPPPPVQRLFFGPELIYVEAKLIYTKELLETYITKQAHKYEGIILRSPSGIYKCGRSTLKEGYLLKYKFTKDSEAMIIGYEPLVQEDGTVLEMLGALTVKDIKTGVEFKIGTGFSEAQRISLWQQRHSVMSNTTPIKYTYQEFGMKDKPRQPVFQCFRLPE